MWLEMMRLLVMRRLYQLRYFKDDARVVQRKPAKPHDAGYVSVTD